MVTKEVVEQADDAVCSLANAHALIDQVINPQRMREGYSIECVLLSVCLSVPSTLEPAAIGTLQLQSQQCLDATLQCLYCFDFLIKALERKHDLYSYYLTLHDCGHFNTSHAPTSLQLLSPSASKFDLHPWQR